MNKQINIIINKVIYLYEIVFVLTISLILLTFTISSIQYFTQLNWGEVSSFQFFIQRMLLLFVGLELLQIARNHNLKDMFLIIIFVVARKALEPLVKAEELILLVVALVILIATWTIISKKQEVIIEEPK